MAKSKKTKTEPIKSIDEQGMQPVIVAEQAILAQLEEVGANVIIGDFNSVTTFSIQVDFNSENFKCKRLVFNNCTFEKNIHFKQLDLGRSISFVKCIFKSQISFYKCHDTNHNQPKEEFDLGSSTFIFEHCTANNFFMQSCEFSHHVVIKSSAFDDFRIDGLESSGKNLIIEESSKFLKSFKLANIELNGGSVLVRNCFFEFEEPILFYFLNAKDIDFLKTKSANQIIIQHCQVNKISYKESTFGGGFYIRDIQQLEKLLVEKSTFGKTSIITIKDPQKLSVILLYPTFSEQFIITSDDKNEAQQWVKKLYIDSPKKQFGGLEIKDMLVERIKFKGIFPKESSILLDSLILEALSFTGDFHKDSSIQLKNIKTKKLILEGNLQKDATILFDDIKTDNIIIKNFANQGNLQFNSFESLTPKLGKLEITTSDLGNTRFFNADFKSMKELLIYHANLSQIVSSDCKWFDYSALASKSETDKTQQYEIKREVFRQLKYALDRQGDRIQALVFKQYEMKAYREQLQNSKKWYNRERIVLSLSSTNDFGQNWGKPILWLLGSTIVFYFLIGLSIYTRIEYNSDNWQNPFFILWEKDKLRLLPQLLNPSVTISKMVKDGEELQAITYALDFLHKLILAFFIFQTILAFRKYSGGKSD